MLIDIAPETERLVREEISSGHFRSVDDLIKAGVEALREKGVPSLDLASKPSDPGNLFDLFTPVRGLLTDNEIDQYFSRDSSPGRAVDLG